MSLTKFFMMASYDWLGLLFAFVVAVAGGVLAHCVVEAWIRYKRS